MPLPPYSPSAQVFYERAFILNAVASGAFAAVLRNTFTLPPGGTLYKYVGLVSAEIIQTSATAMALSLVRITGGTVTTSAPGESCVPLIGTATQSANSRVETAWSVAPIAATLPLKYMQPVAAIGQGRSWAWPEDNPLGISPFIVQVGNGLGIRNDGGAPTGTFQLNLRWCEWNQAGNA